MDHTIRIQRFKSNPLLQRKQFLVEVSHQGQAPLTRQSVREELSKIYKVNDLNRIVVGGFCTKFGGGVSHGFGRIYDTVAAACRFEKNHYLARNNITEKVTRINRRQKKDIRHKRKKVRGIAKAKIGAAKK